VKETVMSLTWQTRDRDTIHYWPIPEHFDESGSGDESCPRRLLWK